MALASAPVAPATTPEVIEGLTPGEARHLQALERRIETGMQTFRSVGLALLEIRDKRLFRMTHASFEAYCKSRWALERGRAYQLMGAAEVAEMLPEGPVNEAQARELVPVFHSDPAMVPKVWAEVEKVAKSGKPVTAPLVREVAREMAGVTAGNGNGGRRNIEPITPTARLLAILARVTEEYVDWLGSKPAPAYRRQVKAAVEQFVATTK